MRLKPHEAQSYRKKALWVSWVSIVVTLILAVAAFSKYRCDPSARENLVSRCVGVADAAVWVWPHAGTRRHSQWLQSQLSCQLMWARVCQ